MPEARIRIATALSPLLCKSRHARPSRFKARANPDGEDPRKETSRFSALYGYRKFTNARAALQNASVIEICNGAERAAAFV